MGDGKECNKKVMEQGDGTYRCEKCMKNKEEFKWRIMLQLNMADCSDNVWASCFQVLSLGNVELSSVFSLQSCEPYRLSIRDLLHLN